MQLTNKKVVPVFFASDDNYIPFLAVALQSIKENAKTDDLYKIYVLSEGISAKTVEEVSLLKTDNIDIEFVDVAKKVEPIRREFEISLRDYYTVSIFYRLFIPSLFPEYDKAIYIDSDVVVKEDIKKLYDIDVNGYLLGAVTDQIVNCTEPFRVYVKKVLGVEPENYINSGVLLMNLKEMREFKLEEKFIDMIIKHNFETVAPDQDYINFICKGKIKYLHPGWDRMSITEDGMDFNDVKLIHYNMYNKPWRYDDVPYEKFFWRYAKNTPYYQTLLDMKRTYPEEKRVTDVEAGGVLLANALRIADSEYTFYKVLG